jgi:hypothetical protein
MLFAAALSWCSLFSCKQRLLPLGKHRGSCSVDYKPLSDPHAQAPASDICPNIFEVWNDGDGYKVDLGDCTVHLKASDKPTDDVWTIASPAPCLTKKGPARMTEGKLYLNSGCFNLSFSGTTDDKRLAVSWGFTSDPTLK